MGAPINEKDSIGQTALHYAVCHHYALQVNIFSIALISVNIIQTLNRLLKSKSVKELMAYT